MASRLGLNQLELAVAAAGARFRYLVSSIVSCFIGATAAPSTNSAAAAATARAVTDNSTDPSTVIRSPSFSPCFAIWRP